MNNTKNCNRNIVQHTIKWTSKVALVLVHTHTHAIQFTKHKQTETEASKVPCYCCCFSLTLYLCPSRSLSRYPIKLCILYCCVYIAVSMCLCVRVCVCVYLYNTPFKTCLRMRHGHHWRQNVADIAPLLCLVRERSRDICVSVYFVSDPDLCEIEMNGQTVLRDSRER